MIEKEEEKDIIMIFSFRWRNEKVIIPEDSQTMNKRNGAINGENIPRQNKVRGQTMRQVDHNVKGNPSKDNNEYGAPVFERLFSHQTEACKNKQINSSDSD